MRRRFLLVVACLLTSGADFAFAESKFITQVQPLLRKFCFECHNNEKAKGDVDLSHFSKDEDLQNAPEIMAGRLGTTQGPHYAPAEISTAFYL